MDGLESLLCVLACSCASRPHLAKAWESSRGVRCGKSPPILPSDSSDGFGRVWLAGASQVTVLLSCLCCLCCARRHARFRLVTGSVFPVPLLLRLSRFDYLLSTFVAALGLRCCVGFALVAVSGGSPLAGGCWLLFAECRLQRMWASVGVVAPQPVGLSQTRDRTHVPLSAGEFLTTGPPGRPLSLLSLFTLCASQPFCPWRVVPLALVYALCCVCPSFSNPLLRTVFPLPPRTEAPPPWVVFGGGAVGKR